MIDYVSYSTAAPEKLPNASPISSHLHTRCASLDKHAPILQPYVKLEDIEHEVFIDPPTDEKKKRIWPYIVIGILLPVIILVVCVLCCYLAMKTNKVEVRLDDVSW